MSNSAQNYCEKLYGWVLKAYPPSHRAEYGEEMAQAFRDLCRDTNARRGNWGLLNAVLFTLLDAVPSIVAEYTAQEMHAMLKRILYSKISTDRQDRSVGPVFAILGAGILAISISALQKLHLDDGQFWLGIFAATVLSLQCALLGLVIHVMKVMNLPTLQYRRVPGQMLKYYFNLPGLFYSTGSLVLIGASIKLEQLHLSEGQLLIGVMITMALAMLCVAMGILFSIAPPAPTQPTPASTLAVE